MTKDQLEADIIMAKARIRAILDLQKDDSLNTQMLIDGLEDALSSAKTELGDLLVIEYMHELSKKD